MVLCRYCGKDFKNGHGMHEKSCEIKMQKLKNPDKKLDKVEPETIVEKIEEKVKEVTKVKDDKIDESIVIIDASPEVATPQESSILSKILIIILGIIAVGAAMFFFINGGNTNDK